MSIGDLDGIRVAYFWRPGSNHSILDPGCSMLDKSGRTKFMAPGISIPFNLYLLKFSAFNYK